MSMPAEQTEGKMQGRRLWQRMLLHVKRGNQLVCPIWAGVTHHLVWGPEGNDFNVAIVIGDGVPVPQPVKVMHHPTATHTLLNDMDLHSIISAERGLAVPLAAPSVHHLIADPIDLWVWQHRHGSFEQWLA